MSTIRLRRSDPQKERYWRGLVQGQVGSGQSVREYCRRAGVKEWAFYWWRRELARRTETRKTAGSRLRAGGRKPGRSSAGDGSRRAGESNRGGRRRRNKPATVAPPGWRPPGSDGSRFVPIHVLAGTTATQPAAAVEIYLGDGRMVRVGPGVDRQTLGEVLAALEVRRC